MLNWIKIAIAAALLASVFGVYQHEKHKFLEQGRAEVQQKWDDAIKRAQEQNKQIEIVKQTEADKKYDEYQAKLKSMQSANDSLSASVIRLRNTIASSNRVPQTSDNQQGFANQREVRGDLLAECAGRYSDMAKEAGRLSEKLNALIDQIGVIY